VRNKNGNVINSRVWDDPEKLMEALLRASDVRWIGRDDYSYHGKAIRKLKSNCVLMQCDDGSREKVPLDKVTDFIPETNQGQTN